MLNAVAAAAFAAVNVTLQELPQRLRLDAVRGLKHIKEAALNLELPDHSTKTVCFEFGFRALGGCWV